MSKASKDTDPMAQLAGRYLDLWLEHWASCLASPETATAVARMFANFTPRPELEIEASGGRPRTRNEPASFRTAHGAGDSRTHELEGRIAALESRLAKLEHNTGDVVARSARRSRTRPGKG